MLRHIDTHEPWNPKVPTNGVRQPRSIETKWTEAELAAIDLEKTPPPEPDTTPPSSDPLDYPLQPFQFFAMLEIMGQGMDPVRDLRVEIGVAIEAIPDTATRAVARAKYEHTTAFHRDNLLFALLAPTLGLTDAEIDTAWMQAKDIA